MFAPKVAKAGTKVGASPANKLVPQRSLLAPRPFGGGEFEQPHMPQLSIGNQARLRLLSQHRFTPPGKETGVDHGQEADPASLTAQVAKTGLSWDFSKISIYPPEWVNRPEEHSSLSAPPLSGVIQPKLAISQADDPLEQEADGVADYVMRMPDPQASLTAAPPQINRECAACKEEEKKTLQTKSAGTARPDSEAPPIVYDVLRLSGEQFDANTRQFFEPRFGYDFSQVRVHTGAKAAESARGINALAYTFGQHVVFGDRQYAPQTTKGKRLLAHELTHVLQQRESDVQWAKSSLTNHTNSEARHNPLEQKQAQRIPTVMTQHGDPMLTPITHPGCSVLQLQQAAPRGNVTSIDPITGPSQSALSGFPALPVCNLNAPGPLNDTTTGSCNNSHQIHFHLAGIRSQDVSLLRIVERTTVVGGTKETIEKSDGPSSPTVIQPSDSLIAVADCPGFDAVHPNPAAFPISYHAHFILSAHDSVLNVVLAKISYDVAIDKKTIDDPSPTNTFSVTDIQIF